jgi:hypothetical protein
MRKKKLKRTILLFLLSGIVFACIYEDDSYQTGEIDGFIMTITPLQKKQHIFHLIMIYMKTKKIFIVLFWAFLFGCIRLQAQVVEKEIDGTIFVFNNTDEVQFVVRNIEKIRLVEFKEMEDLLKTYRFEFSSNAKDCNEKYFRIHVPCRFRHLYPNK